MKQCTGWQNTSMQVCYVNLRNICIISIICTHIKYVLLLLFIIVFNFCTLKDNRSWSKDVCGYKILHEIELTAFVQLKVLWWVLTNFLFTQLIDFPIILWNFIKERETK